eukprot:CAMPEP_0169113202 /NCGR_PEP_ID=MMETSP1015-20121227/28070_1 /TAXON_ID=342587 /ORGANISM="Karlodinium micrum, Strain CCMP2283" /LENGTH=293 /DNA_ID=CAMNT_0009175345 /DNA_START=71 /DNA_END=952 /DNA_ORIENTATION=+
MASSLKQDFQGFRCNFRKPGEKCCTRLANEGWVTACSHIFCQEHAKEWFTTNDDCPICRQGHVKMMKLDMPITDVKKRRKSDVMGMNPNEITEACTTALNFWTDQKIHDIQMAHLQNAESKEQRRKTHQKWLERLKSFELECNSMEKQKSDIKNKLKTLHSANAALTNRLTSLRSERVIIEEACRKLQRSCSAKPKQPFGMTEPPRKDRLEPVNRKTCDSMVFQENAFYGLRNIGLESDTGAAPFNSKTENDFTSKKRGAQEMTSNVGACQNLLRTPGVLRTRRRMGNRSLGI